jgi:O-antigen ligase
LATPSPGAALLAVVTPLVLFHVDYQPGFTVGTGSADVDVYLSDLLLALLAVVVAVRLKRDGVAALRPGLPIWAFGTALLAWIAIGTLLPLLADRDYSFATHAVTAAKFAEYAVLALAVPLLARRQSELELLLAVLAGWAALAAFVGVLQFVGVDVFDAWDAGRRQPSFLGHHDFAALAGSSFAIGLAALVFERHRRFGIAACVAGAVGLVVSGSLAALLGVIAVLAAGALVVLKRRSGAKTLAFAGAGVAVVAVLVVALRGNDLDDFLRFTGVLSEQPQQRGVETYSHRTLLAYLGLRVWLDHPVIGAGWQASGEYGLVSRYVPDAHRRFPDVQEQAFPTPTREYGVQNAYVQALADLGVIGLALFAGLLAAGAWIAERRALQANAWIALAAAGIVLVTAGIWTAQGLLAALGVGSLMWLGLGVAATVPRPEA